MIRIGPERARELREGAQPGPWRTETIDGALHVLFPSGNGAPEEADLPLIAAAPDLAETIAGMEYEYAVQVTNDGGESWRFAHGAVKATFDPIKPCWWFRTEEEAKGFAKFRTTKRSSARVVRRLVTDVEVVE